MYEGVLDETDNNILFNSRSSDNPLSVFRIPIPDTISKLAEAILNDKGDNLSDHEKICAFMDYVQKYQIGIYYDYTPDDYLIKLAKNRIGSCGDYCNMVAALAATQGIKSDIITLANYPENSGHVVLNVFIDGGWNLYDPTYVTYWIDDAGNVLGFDDLSSEHITEVKGIERIIINDSHFVSQMSYEFVDLSIYREANPKGKIGVKNKLYYPNNIKVNQTCDRNELCSTSHQGASYIGIASMVHAQIWNTKGLIKNKKYVLEINAQGIGGEKLDSFSCFARSEDCFIDSDSLYHVFSEELDSYTWLIEFEAKSSEANIVLDFDEESDLFHYVNFESVRLYPYIVTQ